MIKIGPAGATSSGKAWDERGREGIAQIFVSHGDRIHSLQFQFVENGTLVLSDKYGCTSAPKFNSVELNYPSEPITGISGYCGNRDGVRWRCVTSISFITNEATYGPFGYHAPGDTAFDFQIGGHNKFCGFHGTSDIHLYSIGVYMKPMTTLSNVNILQKKENIKNEKASWNGRLFDGILYGVLLQDYMNMTYDRMKSVNDSVIEIVPKCSIVKYSPFQVYV
ncbi:hypothetical protein RHMOL_Rhmol04G0371600 [Rhododendron molle]|uniref:Uncharacterized protein n=1 Tax=Rhododendron molle TaxID=49168 RepID=A0ACC0P8S2_RHOML|nr:hypothetical protein RHMOL_Rhmol04G0371600 [Rhododendron molle]